MQHDDAPRERLDVCAVETETLAKNDIVRKRSSCRSPLPASERVKLMEELWVAAAEDRKLARLRRLKF